MNDTPLLEQYETTARQIRAVYEQATRGTGKRGRGPKFIAVTQCVECHGFGLTTSKITQKKRWACKTCGQTALPAWTDGPVPDEDEIYETWAKGQTKAAGDQLVAKGHGNFVGRHGCSIKKRGDRCPLCDGSPPIPG
jgi:hypothetical protein